MADIEQPTPPADDVREALASLIDAEAGSYNPVTHADRHDLHEGLTRADGSDMADWITDRILYRFEVRLRGTVAEPEPSAGQILAGLNAEAPARFAAPSLDYYGSGSISRMRNVLRAALNA